MGVPVHQTAMVKSFCYARNGWEPGGKEFTCGECLVTEWLICYVANRLGSGLGIQRISSVVNLLGRGFARERIS